ncbi:hypothetical protein TWF106_005392 [Orbilia oligospora]|uniref:Uncharacterized protein n=1 Tax=Orbilia oligospora TaxID=2813651 RepID=A0A7C8U399_ORBOL|nr:hypothetical protein TWF106_005392 [Orbilia oligospora]
MSTFKSSKGDIIVFFFFLFSTLLALDTEDPGFYDIFPSQVPTDVDTSTLQVDLSSTRPELENLLVGSSWITLLIENITYCLTDPGDRLQPMTNQSVQNFATLEECDFGGGKPGQMWSLWPGTAGGQLITRAPKRDINNQDPFFPYYAVNYTHYGIRGLRNEMTGRCLRGDSSYPGSEVKIPDYNNFADRDDYFGFVYLSEYCPQKGQQSSGVFDVRNALVGSGYTFHGADANPRWTYPEIKEVLYFDNPTLLSRTWNCPKLPSTRQENITEGSPDPSEAEYRTRTLIIPHLVEANINNTSFHPALFGCANNTNKSLPSFKESPIKSALYKYGDSVTEIQKCNERKRDEWYKNVEYYKGLPQCYGMAGIFRKWYIPCQPYLRPGGKIEDLWLATEKYYEGSIPDVKECSSSADWVV